ncbi:MAG: type II toxin-antitoxin system RelE/ParE family toxin [Victivallales bacterium]|nr:type II toxin-antitoxin system RelE/ParE family toxin [Victivallales bacterium]
MIIEYKTKELEKCASDIRYATKTLGADCARRLHSRLTVLANAETFETIRNTPGRFHELKDNRKGQWSMDLVHPYRLIITPLTQPIPTDKDGKYIWTEIKDALIVEIVDYHT